MAIDAGLLFKIKADGSQAKAEARATAKAVENAFDKDPFADFRLRMDDMRRRLTSLKDSAHDASRGVDDLEDSAKRTSGRNGGVGQFIGALAQGDPAEVLQEIAQNGGKAGIAVAGVALAAGAAAVAIFAMTKRMIDLVRETDKLAKDTKLSSTQIQGLQIVANLTGESVEDLAENYKKLGPEVKRFEDLVRSSGAAIDEDLRRKVQDSALAWEGLKIVSQGALNAIARELLPVVTNEINLFTAALGGSQSAMSSLGQIAGDVLGDISLMVRTAVADLGLLISGIDKISSGNFRAGFSDIGGAIRGTINDEVSFGGVDFGSANGFPKVPKLGSGGGRRGGGGGGRKDISESELQIRLLKTEQDAAQNALNGTREAAARLYEITLKLYEAERQQAASELPRGRAAKLAEIQQKEKEALEKYSELIKKVADEELKPFEQLGKQINKDNAEALRLIQEQIEAERQLKSLRLERRDIEADLLEQSALTLARSGGSQLKVAERQARAAAIREDVAFERAILSIERERQEAEANEDFARVKELNALMEAEQRRHVGTLAEIGRSLDAFNERLNPTSRRSLFGDGFADLRAAGQSNLQALAEVARQSFAQMSADAGNFASIAGGALGAVTQGLGQMVAEFILSGETGPAAMRKLAAGVLAGVAQQAAVKAIFELAEGFANLAKAAVGHPTAGAAAVLNFKSAAIFGSVAAIAGFAARAAAPASAGGNGASGGGGGSSDYRAQPRIINQDTKPQSVQIILRVEEGIVAKRAAADYQNNGVLRQIIRADMGAV